MKQRALKVLAAIGSCAWAIVIAEIGCQAISSERAPEQHTSSESDPAPATAIATCDPSTTEPVCSGTDLLVCADGQLVTEDCAAQGKVCVQQVCAAPAEDCDLDAWPHTLDYVLYDPDLMGTTRLVSLAPDRRVDPDHILELALIARASAEVGAYDLGKRSEAAGGDILLLGQSYDWDTGRAVKYFVGLSGTVTVTEASNTRFSFSSPYVILAEVDGDSYALLENGQRWCLSDLSIATDRVRRYTCDYLDIEPGESACSKDSTGSARIAACQKVGEAPDWYWFEGEDELVDGGQCGKGETCRDSDPVGAAECVAP